MPLAVREACCGLRVLIRSDQRAGEEQILVAARNADADVVLRVERADYPVEQLAARRQTQLLRELLDVVALDEVELASWRRIDVDVEGAVEIDVAGHARERRGADPGVHRQSHAGVVDV